MKARCPHLLATSNFEPPNSVALVLVFAHGSGSFGPGLCTRFLHDRFGSCFGSRRLLQGGSWQRRSCGTFQRRRRRISRLWRRRSRLWRRRCTWCGSWLWFCRCFGLGSGHLSSPFPIFPLPLWTDLSRHIFIISKLINIWKGLTHGDNCQQVRR